MGGNASFALGATHLLCSHCFTIRPKSMSRGNVRINQGCITRGPRAGSERVLSGPRSRLKIQERLLNDEYFMNKFKLHWTISNFETYYNTKQLWWQQYQTTCNKKRLVKFKQIRDFYTWLPKALLIILSSALERTKNITLRPLALPSNKVHLWYKYSCKSCLISPLTGIIWYRHIGRRPFGNNKANSISIKPIDSILSLNRRTWIRKEQPWLKDEQPTNSLYTTRYDTITIRFNRPIQYNAQTFKTIK